ncbi:MAG TPA: ABC transporter ATP-binding protein [Candidatus Eisenbacteria bacterium]|jgi:branched-chain amino acid transport system ATP-binding protein|nr:ABC transporter ATP-binding protein [Candidatus Eisenbacteria bacterium]
MLEVRHVYTHYGKVECLKGVSFTVNKGEIVALLGGNGAGKTTTLKTVSGLIRPSAGEVLFQGKSLASQTPQAVVRLGISHVPEGRRIFQRLDVLENLELGAWVRFDREAAAADLERIFGIFPLLKKRLKQRAGTLSGGEQQMLAIGRALMSRPAVLLLDEPSLGLAPILVSSIFKMIETVHAQGMTILLVEQNARMALKVASRAYVLETGKVVLEGSAREIERDPAVRGAYLGGG